ncbi:hypothetical protein CLHUN_12860 [Ruminiclostridium hungatei]|uniref:Uncharacterized protein n=1 Tax=Ruminiclostridium hungatei TaxID=48256 RepID=A0A1V4SMK2_RUMHU|nr:hypothetical protein CLHUN_12860 [Ruminiclostridium hungatei]
MYFEFAELQAIRRNRCIWQTGSAAASPTTNANNCTFTLFPEIIPVYFPIPSINGLMADS